MRTAKELEPPLAVVPFLPMLYSAWADGELSSEELLHVRARVEASDGLDEDTRKWLESWLDPSHPPDAAALRRLLSAIELRARSIDLPERLSLLELGVAIAGSEPSTAERAALDALEAALDVAAPEAREILGPKAAPRPLEPTEPEGGALDVAALIELLDAPYQDVRAQIRALVSEPAFARAEDGAAEPRAAYRERVYGWLRELARRGYGRLAYPSLGGDLGRFMAVFEALAVHDISLVVKLGVHFGLFGGSVYFLGTDEQRDRLLPDVATLATPGCFAMTELGHGSNVRDVETVARFDRARGGFVLTTPSESARKEFIGNAALHARMATVFASLEIDDEDYGVHAFLVPIRDEAGQPMPGVRIADAGQKMGLNGVDNGSLWFDDVLVPRDQLLGRFAAVSADGAYTSPIASPGSRFFTMLGTLVGGRVSVAKAALSASKVALTIAVRHGHRRRQFGPAGGAEARVLDYPTHQRRLMPALAAAYALDAALEHLVERYLARSDADAREIETMAAGLKAVATWTTTETLQRCRECCGGRGYLWDGRIAELMADTDVFTTFEGDNTVLMQLVSKGLLTDYKERFDGGKFRALARIVASRTWVAATEQNPVATRRTDPDHLRDPELHASALKFREETLLAGVARRLQKLLRAKVDPFAAFTQCQIDLVELAGAHVDRIVVEASRRRVDSHDTGPNGAALLRLHDLHALSCLERNAAWYLERDYFADVKTRAIADLCRELSAEVRGDALDLVAAFAIPDACLPSWARKDPS